MTPRSATMSLFDTEDSLKNPQRTFVIFGVNRGGTTSVAGVFTRLGIYLGEDGEDTGGNLEDVDFRMKRGLPAIVQTVHSRNVAHDIWGWKHPNPRFYLKKILPELRNPRFVVVTRDLTANAKGMVKRKDAPPKKALEDVVERTSWNLNFVLKRRLPTLLVSYEKLLVRPVSAAEEMAAFCGVEMDEQTRKSVIEFVEPGSYKPVSETVEARAS